MGDSPQAAAEYVADRDQIEEEILANKTTMKFAKLYKDLQQIKARHRLFVEEHNAVTELMEKVGKLIEGMIWRFYQVIPKPP
jgi:hypothetical protein